MKKVLAFSGSLSSSSINHTLIEHVSSLLTEEITVIRLADFSAPLYTKEEEEANGIPENIKKLRVLFDEADAFIISTPEYNGSVPGGFKNILDWISRMEGSIFQNKPTLLLATSPGGRGGKTVLNHLSDVLPFWGASLVGTFSLPKFYENFGEDGLNSGYREELKGKLNVLSMKLSD